MQMIGKLYPLDYVASDRRGWPLHIIGDKMVALPPDGGHEGAIPVTTLEVVFSALESEWGRFDDPSHPGRKRKMGMLATKLASEKPPFRLTSDEVSLVKECIYKSFYLTPAQAVFMEESVQPVPEEVTK